MESDGEAVVGGPLPRQIEKGTRATEDIRAGLGVGLESTLDFFLGVDLRINLISYVIPRV